jgi:hypothetical protein
LKKGLLDGGIATPAEKKVLIISKIAWKQSFLLKWGNFHTLKTFKSFEQFYEK